MSRECFSEELLRYWSNYGSYNKDVVTDISRAYRIGCDTAEGLTQSDIEIFKIRGKLIRDYAFGKYTDSPILTLEHGELAMSELAIKYGLVSSRKRQNKMGLISAALVGIRRYKGVMSAPELPQVPTYLSEIADCDAEIEEISQEVSRRLFLGDFSYISISGNIITDKITSLRIARKMLTDEASMFFTGQKRRKFVI